MTRRPRVLMATVLIAMFALRCACAVARAVSYWGQFGAVPYTSHFPAGLASTAQYVRGSGSPEVRGLAADPNTYVLQRLTEMAYPVVYRPASVEDFAKGDRVVLAHGEALERPYTVCHEDGMFRIVRVER